VAELHAISIGQLSGRRGQLLTGHTRRLRSFIALSVAAVLAAACRTDTGSTSGAAEKPASAIVRGGEIVASVRSEPRTFNRLTARDTTSDLVSELTQAKLVRINKITQAVEPWLAESWSLGQDRRTYTIRLRPNLTFSDGHPFTADDVVFAFAAVYDEKTASILADSLKAGGKKLSVSASDPQTVVVTFPFAFAPGVRLLENLPILPRHKLEPALKAGKLAEAWGLSTPPSEVVGMGPFVLREYTPGQRLRFERNPRYWRRAPDGGPLPYLDRVTVDVIPDQNAELLRLESGQIDTMSGEVAPESYATMKRAAREGRVRLLDLGPVLWADSFWFNLKPGAFAGDARAAWLQRDELRRAISMAVDRKAFADAVFLGAAEPAYSFVTSANKEWYWTGTPATPHDPAGAKALLASIGLTDRNGDGLLYDASGQPARFSIITQKGRPRLERGAAVVRDELKKIGLTVDVAVLDANAVIERLVSARYEAAMYPILPTDTDPGSNPDFWFSSGSFHLWNMSEPKPATDWERRVDELMAKQIGSMDQAERKRLFDEVQQIMYEHQPVVYFAAPKMFVVVSSRLVNATPAVYPLPVLWAADTIAVRPR
jgi:peptide/nickel transport system substrate-binding protein